MSEAPLLQSALLPASSLHLHIVAQQSLQHYVTSQAVAVTCLIQD